MAALGYLMLSIILQELFDRYATLSDCYSLAARGEMAFHSS